MNIATSPARFGQRQGPTELLVGGRLLLADGTERSCCVRFDSEDVATVFAAADPAMFDRVLFRLEEVGSLSGIVVANDRASFEIRLEGSGERRRRVQTRLDWLKAHAGGREERRSEIRIVPRQRTVPFRRPGEEPFTARILDVSPSGASLSMPIRPGIGETVLVGRRYAEVVRHSDEGVAVRFKLPFAQASFGEDVEL